MARRGLFKVLSLLGCAEDDSSNDDVKRQNEALVKQPPVEYACFCFPVAEDEPPVFVPDGEQERD